MRLSDWRASAPTVDALAPKVESILEPVLASLGADPDPEAWIVWGDDPRTRWLLLVPTPIGLAEVNVRVNVPGEGPRAAGRLVRWSHVQLGDFQIEVQAGHRLLGFQLENQVLRAVDDQVPTLARFARMVMSAIDGRPFEEPVIPLPASQDR